MSEQTSIIVRATESKDFDGIIDVTRNVYPGSPAWTHDQLSSHVRRFPEGQFVAVAQDSGAVVGMSASLIILWDDYELTASWRDFTDAGMFTNHDPAQGRTLYGAEIMVVPRRQGLGTGSKLYAAREALVRQLGVLRIRAGARLRDYAARGGDLTAEDYVRAVTAGTLVDRTLTFQLRRGFRVIGMVGDYLRHDPESRGHAAVIEWINPDTGGCT
ncbi:MAG: GNAT family N-acetyltransferase [bacterium]